MYNDMQPELAVAIILAVVFIAAGVVLARREAIKTKQSKADLEARRQEFAKTKRRCSC